MKDCRICGQAKVDEEFYPDPANLDGKKTACKDCLRVEVRTRYWNNVDAERMRARTYARKRRERNRNAVRPRSQSTA
jgi:hypothetical protein